MGIDNLRAGGGEDGRDVLLEGKVSRAFHSGAGVIELEHRAVAADHRCGVLLFAADRFHLHIAEVRIHANARASGAVGAGHAAEPSVIAGEAFENSMKGHELEIVLMRADAEVGDAGKCFRFR